MAEKRSWLEGPQVPGEYDDPTHESEYPGQTLGLARSGPGSRASLGRRLFGMLVDWFVSMLIAQVFYLVIGPDPKQIEQFGDPFIAWQSFTVTWTAIVFFFLGTISVWLFARTPGQAVMRMGVARIDAAERVGLWRAAVRSALTLMLLPPVVQDTDGRGMHDRATGTAVILG